MSKRDGYIAWDPENKVNVLRSTPTSVLPNNFNPKARKNTITVSIDSLEPKASAMGKDRLLTFLQIPIALLRQAGKKEAGRFCCCSPEYFWPFCQTRGASRS